MASGQGSTIGGGNNNVAAGPSWTVATIGGGEDNKASAYGGTVSGGTGNTASGLSSTVGGGGGNVANEWGATVPGGLNNTAGMLSFAAGYRAKAVDWASFVWGDGTEADVTSAGPATFVVRASGGAFFSHNLTAGGIVSAPAFSGDGSGLTGVNAATAVTATSATTAAEATNALALGGVGAGTYARLDVGNSFTGDQSISGNLSLSGSINGGLVIQPSGYSPNIIGGFSGNYVSEGVGGAAIGGGGEQGIGVNRVTDGFGTVSGGVNNQAGDGAGVKDDRPFATVGGGVNNTASGYQATVAGGYGNTASSHGATVGGGWENTASSAQATVPGGFLNTADGGRSFAAGYRAKALHEGAFVWGDSTEADVESSGNNQFVVRASGGAIFSNDVSAASFHGDGSGLTNVPAGTANDLNCAGCVSSSEVAFNYAGSDGQGGAATSALTAAEATNALNLGGVAASNFARRDSGNTFTNTQTIGSGDLSLTSGNISLPETTSATAGVISLGGIPFVHSCCHGSTNSFLGRNAGNFTTTGDSNTASGGDALSSNTTGYNNTASGSGALVANTTGNYNTADGNAALLANTTGNANTASGWQALQANTTGSSNTASGEAALYTNTEGNDNTALGDSSGFYNSTGSNNTFIGVGAGPDSGHGDLTNATAIGAGAVVSQSNSLILGGTGDWAVNVGIGTATPGQKLTVVGVVESTSGGFKFPDGTTQSTAATGGGTATDLNCSGCVSTSELDFVPATQEALNAEVVARANADTVLQTDVSSRVSKGGDIMLGTLNLPANGLVAGTNQLVLSAGNVGVGTATPAEKLEVNGTVKATGFSGDGSGLTNIQGSQIVNTVNTLQVALLRWYGANQAAISFPTGSGPRGVAFDGAHIWVSDHFGNTVTKLRASDGANLGSFAAGTLPLGIAFDGANIWVANRGGTTVTKLRASDGAAVGTYTVGSDPQCVAFDGTNIWVSNHMSTNVTKLRASDGAYLDSFPVGANPAGVAFDGANIWVANSGSSNVTKLRASDGANLGTFAAGNSPGGIAFDGANIWVTNSASNTVTKLRASDGESLGAFAVGTGPRTIAFDGACIWVANYDSDDVTKLRASDGANLGTFAVGSGPWGVAFDGANIWVANLNSSTISKL